MRAQTSKIFHVLAGLMIWTGASPGLAQTATEAQQQAQVAASTLERALNEAAESANAAMASAEKALESATAATEAEVNDLEAELLSIEGVECEEAELAGTPLSPECAEDEAGE